MTTLPKPTKLCPKYFTGQLGPQTHPTSSILILSTWNFARDSRTSLKTTANT